MIYVLAVSVSMFSLLSCNGKEQQSAAGESNDANSEMQNEQLFIQAMQKHLNAVSNRDLEILESTMSPTGEMQLILPQTEIINNVEGFMDYHRQWFKDTTAWTFETKILNTKIGNKVGMAVTEVVYREPERNGQPYFNRMVVSYVLEKIDGEWYVIKDHASTVEKSTDESRE